MTAIRARHHRRQRVLRSAGPRRTRAGRRSTALGRAVRPDPVRRDRRAAVRFLPRHGRGHRLSPSGINYRANIDAMKRAGVTDLVSISACGSFREELAPGHFVLVDQFIDRTFAREKSFFGNGLVAHVVDGRSGEPAAWSIAVEAAAKAEGIAYTRGGTYLVMEGPQFSTRAESNLYRSWGCDVIGMTNMPEAKLAREAEICYATVAMVTDYDCWHDEHQHVDVAADHQGDAGQHREGAAAGRAARPRLPARAPALPDRLRPRARRGADHRARGARSGAGRQARRGGGAGAVEQPRISAVTRLSVAGAARVLVCRPSALV